MGAIDTSGALAVPKCGRALDRIIEASRLEFDEIGPAAAKIDSIAARAKITRQSIYYYYKSKDEIRELFFGLLDQASKFSTLSAFMIDHGRNAESIRKPSAAFKDLMRQFVKRLQVLLDRGAAEGVFRPDVDAARFFAASCMITAGARNSHHALELTCGIDVTSSEGVADWQEFAVDLLMRSIKKTD